MKFDDFFLVQSCLIGNLGMFSFIIFTMEKSNPYTNLHNAQTTTFELNWIEFNQLDASVWIICASIIIANGICRRLPVFF
jgi:hypothetical protein